MKKEFRISLILGHVFLLITYIIGVIIDDYILSLVFLYYIAIHFILLTSLLIAIKKDKALVILIPSICVFVIVLLLVIRGNRSLIYFAISTLIYSLLDLIFSLIMIVKGRKKVD
ncbi:hypothetical protein ACAG96_07450 [Candidatus Izemoplasma sp. B36]|uniref:hypothetical protein n=1 Tax=Candidatus Izemoplasma sp. B36 TaxID=3242468 RepID=UPI0035584F64